MRVCDRGRQSIPTIPICASIFPLPRMEFLAWNRGVHLRIPRNIIAIAGPLQVDNIVGIVGIYKI